MITSRPGVTTVRTEFDRIFVDLLPRLYRRALALTGDPHTAEDGLHEAYLKLVTHPARMVDHPLPYAYAFTAVVSALRDGWRRRRREVLREHPTDLPTVVSWDGRVAGWDGGVAHWEAERETVRLLARLTPRQAAVVLLVDVDGYTIDQAAEVLGLHRGTVSRSRGRALDKLRSLLATERSAGSRCPTMDAPGDRDDRGGHER